MTATKVKSGRFLLAALGTALASVAALLPGLEGGFVLDDGPSILQNAALRVSHLADVPYAVYSFQPGHGSRMLSMATFALDAWRSGLDPAAFRLTNILIHALTAIAVACFFSNVLVQTGRTPRQARCWAIALAAAWALHPLQVSCVLYIVQRMQTLVTLFGVLALNAYLRMRQAQISGERSRGHAVLAVLFMVLGLASKEDAALYPLFALAMELTILRFAARDPRVGRILRVGASAFVALSVVVMAAYVIPRHWHWDNVPGRDFTTLQRLMTQPRVLVIYLGQMLVPLPSLMPFFYDSLPISQGLFSPVTTALALLTLIGLAAWAWSWRRRRPLFAFGILIFFAGHAITSNVLNLELAFEHRNQFPLIGIVLAVGDLYSWVRDRTERRQWLNILAGGALLALAGTTAARAYEWGDPIRFGRYSVRLNPNSPRAWSALGGAYYEAVGGRPNTPYFAKAIAVNEEGAARTGSPSLYSNVVIYKTRQGDVSKADWERLLRSVDSQPFKMQTQFMLFIMLQDADNGMPLDSGGMVALIDAIAPKGSFGPNEYRRFGAYIYNNSDAPVKAYPYMKLSVEQSPKGDPDTERMFRQLIDAGREDWVKQLQQVPRPPESP